MSTAAKKKGTAHESAIVEYAKTHGFPLAHRNAMAGTKDIGDVNLRARFPVVLEAKNTKGYDLATAMREAKAEAENYGDTALPVVVKKRPGVGDVGRSYAVLEFEDFLWLLRQAGY